MKSRRCFPLLCVLVTLLAASAFAEEEKPRWKILQVKQCTVKPEVGVSPEALDFFYKAIFERMQESKLAERVVDHATTVPPEDAADSVVLEGVITFLDLERPGRLRATFNLYRVSDHRLLMTKPWQVAALQLRKPSVFRIAGRMAAGQIIKPARELPRLATFPLAPPEPAAPVAVTAAAAAPAAAPPPSSPATAGASNLPAMPHHAGPYAALGVKSVTIAPGVEFPREGGDAQAYLDGFNDRFLEELVKQKFAARAVPEGGDMRAAGDAYIIEGTITGFRVEERNTLARRTAVGVMTFHFTFSRVGDRAPLGVMTVVVDSLVLGAFTKPKTFVGSVPRYLVGEMKKQ